MLRGMRLSTSVVIISRKLNELTFPFQEAISLFHVSTSLIIVFTKRHAQEFCTVV